MRSILSFLIVASLTSSVSAAPIQGVIDAQTGFVYASGLWGEIFVALKVPTAFALPDPDWVGVPPDPSQPAPGFTEYHRLGLGGIHGTQNFGNIVKPNLRQSDFTTFRLKHQVSFISELVEFAPSFVGHSAAIPTGQAGLFVIIPEPASLTLIALMMGTLLTAVRLHGRRQRSPVMSQIR